jgi:hypothetical protein
MQLSALKITVSNPVQFKNALFPIVETALPIVKDDIPLHPEKALAPIDVVELGIVTRVSPVQFWKA